MLIHTHITGDYLTDDSSLTVLLPLHSSKEVQTLLCFGLNATYLVNKRELPNRYSVQLWDPVVSVTVACSPCYEHRVLSTYDPSALPIVIVHTLLLLIRREAFFFRHSAHYDLYCFLESNPHKKCLKNHSLGTKLQLFRHCPPKQKIPVPPCQCEGWSGLMGLC